LSFGKNTVITIIGILAAIAIPVFHAQREKAWAASAASELRNAAAAATNCAADNDGAYDAPNNCGDEATLKSYGWSNDPDVDQTFTATATQWDGDTNHVNFTVCHTRSRQIRQTRTRVRLLIMAPVTS
jgi:type II secretory pathway pseudopilin PulG